MTADIHTLTGAYALDALAGTERGQFEAHLAQCPECRREVDELRATAARLAQAAAETPPERLRRRVMAEIAVTRQDPPIEFTGPDGAGLGGSGGTATGGSGGTVRPLRARRPSGVTRLAASVAVLATAAAVVLGVLSAQAAAERDSARAQLADARAQLTPVTRLVSASDARGDSGTGVRGGSAFVLASHALDEGMLVTSGLPAPPAGHAYQAWLIGSGHARSVGVLASGRSGNRIVPLLFAGLGGASKVGLTVEPAGGSPQPTTTPVVLFGLPSEAEAVR